MEGLFENLTMDQSQKISGIDNYEKFANWYVENIRLNVEDILNTRCFGLDKIANYPELAQSVVAYGVPDILGYDLGIEENRNNFCSIVKNQLEMFESRLSDIKVGMVELRDDQADEAWGMKIAAEIIAKNFRMDVGFEALINEGRLSLAVLDEEK